MPEIRWVRVLARAALEAIIASAYYVGTRETHWTIGAFIVATAIFFVPGILLFLIIDVGGTLLADERLRNERSGAPPEPLDPEWVWRQWRAEHHDRG